MSWGKRSIQARLSVTTFLGIVLLVASILLTSYYFMSSVLNVNIAKEMNLMTRNYANDINQKLQSIEEVVDSIGLYITDQNSDATVFRNKQYRDKYTQQLQNIFISMANSTDGVLAAYLRYEPKLADGGMEGFFYTSYDGGNLKPEKLTDLHRYPVPKTKEEVDVEHVGWYYYPKFNARPTWLDPYYNDNIGVYLISYVVPLYINGTFVGVLGLDMDFQQIVSQVNTYTIIENGYAYLKSSDGKIHYHDDFMEKTKEEHGDDVIKLDENGELMEADSTGDKIIRYRYNSRDCVMAFTTLRNKMKLVVCDDYGEVYAVRGRLEITLLLLSVFLGTFLVIMVWFSTKRTLSTLMQLTDSANELSNGRFDVDFPENSTGEVKILTDAMKTMAVKLKESDSNMRYLAYIDSLTNVRNKAAYIRTVEAIDEQIKSGKPEFAVGMFDLNYLKRINDSLGHVEGDVKLREMAAILCEVFPITSVYRIGGDEFVLILREYDLKNYEESLVKFYNRRDRERHFHENLLENTSVSAGFAVYDPEKDHCYMDVYERADKEMYEDKKVIHSEDGMESR